jgi:hypothetical protein
MEAAHANPITAKIQTFLSQKFPPIKLSQRNILAKVTLRNSKELSQLVTWRKQYVCPEWRDCELNCIRNHVNSEKMRMCRQTCPNCTRLARSEIYNEYAHPINNNAVVPSGKIKTKTKTIKKQKKVSRKPK